MAITIHKTPCGKVPDDRFHSRGKRGHLCLVRRGRQADPVKYPCLLSSVLSDVCSFPVVVHSAIDVTDTVFVDASGAVTKMQKHIVEQDTFSANGKTLVGLPFAFNIQVLFDSSGDWTHAYTSGVIEKVPLPDGSISSAPDGWIGQTI